MIDEQLRKAFEAAYFEACRITPRWSNRGWYQNPDHQWAWEWFKRGAELEHHVPDAGKLVKQVPLTPDQRVDICDACEALDLGENSLVDIGKIIDLVEAAHGIRGAA